MRIFIYGMQSSGSTLLALLLAQQVDRLGVLDLWIPFVAPVLDGVDDVVLKATVSETSLQAHLNSFRPDVSILNLRNPVDVVSSLNTKSYRDFGGSLEYKLSISDDIFAKRDRFDLVLTHEMVVADPVTAVRRIRSTGIELPGNAQEYRRSVADVREHALLSNKWCVDNYRIEWGLGNVHDSELWPPQASAYVQSGFASEVAASCCPRLLEYYSEEHMVGD